MMRNVTFFNECANGHDLTVDDAYVYTAQGYRVKAKANQ